MDWPSQATHFMHIICPDCEEYLFGDQREQMHVVEGAASRPPKVICVDFDQTLCDSKFPDVGPPKAGAREAMQAFHDMGFYLVVSSCRASSYHWEHYYGDAPVTPAVDRPVYQSMVRWLEENAIPFDEVDDGTKGKVGAEYYLDDKAVRYENNWPDVVRKIQELESGAVSKNQLRTSTAPNLREDSSVKEYELKYLENGSVLGTVSADDMVVAEGGVVKFFIGSVVTAVTQASSSILIVEKRTEKPVVLPFPTVSYPEDMSSDA